MSAYEELEDYYIRFPVNLLKFDDLEFPYQAEAMIWMHGLFIVLCESFMYLGLVTNRRLNDIHQISNTTSSASSSILS